MPRMIHNPCPQCGNFFKIDARAVGTQVPCPSCTQMILVVEPAASEAPSSAAGANDLFPGMVIGAVIAMLTTFFLFGGIPWMVTLAVVGASGAVVGGRLAGLISKRKAKHWFCNPWAFVGIPLIGLSMLSFAFLQQESLVARFNGTNAEFWGLQTEYDRTRDRQRRAKIMNRLDEVTATRTQALTSLRRFEMPRILMMIVGGVLALVGLPLWIATEVWGTEGRTASS